MHKKKKNKKQKEEVWGGKNEKKWVTLALGLQCDGQIEKRERAREKEEWQAAGNVSASGDDGGILQWVQYSPVSSGI